MVVKRCVSGDVVSLRFESSVILYGSETEVFPVFLPFLFESSVILYGSERRHPLQKLLPVFESSVILYGSERTTAA